MALNGSGRTPCSTNDSSASNSNMQADCNNAEPTDEDDFICILDDLNFSLDDQFEMVDLKYANCSSLTDTKPSTNCDKNMVIDSKQSTVFDLYPPCDSEGSSTKPETLYKFSNKAEHNVLPHQHNSIEHCSITSNGAVNGLSSHVDNLLQNSTTTQLSQPDSSKLLPYNRLKQWIYCIAVVNFDIEIGQSIECIVPNDAHLTEREISNICYLSFPDSNSGCMGDTQFHFRTKACPVDRSCFEEFFKDFNSKCLHVLEVDQQYFYGYVYFRQVKDCMARRGYFQKSLVILSWFPFVSLFSKIMKILAPQYFELGVISLEAACEDINRWPEPNTGQILNLPLLGTVTQVLVPDDKYNCSSMCQVNHVNLKKYSTSSLSLKSLSLLRLKKISKEPNSDSELSQSSPPPSTSSSPYFTRQLVINVSNDINIYRALRPIIPHIQLLWELVLTNEPVAVITQTPNICSEVVISLVHCISPLKYGADYRPFFTIHDSEFKEYTSHTKSPPPVILGVTNPFFVKTLQDWPHLIKINEFAHDQNKSVNMNSTLKKCPNKSLELKTGVYTKYKPFLQKDREILKKLLKGMESSRPSEAQNALLRRFFIELTQSFLIPLERYFASLMPLAKNLSPFKRPPILQHFKVEEFISSLEATGPQLTSGIKGDWTGLYRRFLRSPNFVCWYNNRMKKANDKLRTLHIETICDSNIADLVTNKPEVEIVDLILKLKESLESAANGELQINSDTVERLRTNLNKIIGKLPEDSRVLFENKIE